jgi:hypothetical protein
LGFLGWIDRLFYSCYTKYEKSKFLSLQSALDFLVTVQYETGYNRIVLNKMSISEDFFHLKTKLAGEILQKFINYGVKLAIIGDFSVYTSKSLKAFIYECNKRKDIFFLPDEKQAIEKLSTL